MPSFLKFRALTTIVLVNMLLFIGMAISGGMKVLILPSSQTLLNFGASSAAATVLSSQYGRIVSYAFVHVGLIHLGLNMYVLLDAGREVEKLYGAAKFVVIYLCSAIAGALASLLVNPTLISAGASGAIFGLFGAMFAIAWRRHNLFPKGFLLLHGKIILFLIAGSMAYSFFDKNLDNAAHFGGLLGGFLSGLCLLPEAEMTSNWKLKEGLRLSVLLTVYVVLLCSARNAFQNRPDLIADDCYRQAIDLLGDEKYSGALPLLNRAIALAPNNAFIRHDRARAYAELKQYDKALEDCNEALKISPDDKIAFSTRASVFHKIGNYQESVNDLTHAIKLNPQNATFFNNRAWSLEAMGKYKEALDDSNKAIQLDGNLATAYDTRAVAYILSSQYPAALADLDKAISIKAKDGTYYYHRSIVYRHLNEPSQSEEDLRRLKNLEYKPESWEPL